MIHLYIKCIFIYLYDIKYWYLIYAYCIYIKCFIISYIVQNLHVCKYNIYINIYYKNTIRVD